MSGRSWVVAECMIALLCFGGLAWYAPPKDPVTFGMIVTAIIGLMLNRSGSQDGASLPQQVGDVRPGQASQSETTTTTATQSAEPVAAPASDTVKPTVATNLFGQPT